MEKNGAIYQPEEVVVDGKIVTASGSVVVKKFGEAIFVEFSALKVKDFSDLRKKLKGEIALIFALKDEILPTKIVWQFSQENPNLKIL